MRGEECIGDGRPSSVHQSDKDEDNMKQDEKKAAVERSATGPGHSGANRKREGAVVVGGAAAKPLQAKRLAGSLLGGISGSAGGGRMVKGEDGSPEVTEKGTRESRGGEGGESLLGRMREGGSSGLLGSCLKKKRRLGEISRGEGGHGDKDLSMPGGGEAYHRRDGQYDGANGADGDGDGGTGGEVAGPSGGRGAQGQGADSGRGQAGRQRVGSPDACPDLKGEDEDGTVESGRLRNGVGHGANKGDRLPASPAAPASNVACGQEEGTRRAAVSGSARELRDEDGRQLQAERQDGSSIRGKGQQGNDQVARNYLKQVRRAAGEPVREGWRCHWSW